MYNPLSFLGLISIRQKILFAALVPAVVFYLLVTLVCLYFSYYAVTTEIRGRYIEEALYAGAVIEANARELIMMARIIEQTIKRKGVVDRSKIVYLLQNKLNNAGVLRGIGFVNDFLSDSLEGEYWKVIKQEVKKCNLYRENVSSYLQERMKSIFHGKKEGVHWVTESVYENLDDFHASVVLLIKVNSGFKVVHIDLDGNKLASYWDFNNVNVFGGAGLKASCQLNDISNRLNFCRRFTLRDAEGVTLYTTGRSAKYYRTLDEKIIKMPSLLGMSKILSYKELIDQSFFEFISNNKILPIEADNPNRALVDMFKRASDQGEILHFRFMIRRNWRIWCTVVPIRSLGWVLQAYMPEKDILRPVYQQLIFCLALSIVALLIVVASLLVIADRASKPLRKLKDEMNEYAKKIEPDVLFQEFNDEVVSLNRSFAQFIKCINDRDETLDSMRANNIFHLENLLNESYFCFTIDETGTVTYVSPSVYYVLGIDSDNFKGRFEDYLTSSPINKRFNGVVKSLLQGCSADSFEVEMAHIDGSLKRVKLFCCLVTGILPQRKSIEGIANDITEHIADTEKFKLLIASSPEAMVITNSDGIISIANRRVYKLFGYPFDVLINMPVSIMVPDVSLGQSPLVEFFKSGLKDRVVNRFEYFGVKKGGEVFPIDVSTSVINTSQGCLVSIVIRDISERKRIEGELVCAKEKAEQSDRAKTLFLSNMSHELRTPLNGVLGYSQILIGDKTLKESHRSKIKSIEECGRHLLTLINDILDVAKVESGRVNIECKPFSIKTLVDKAVSIIKNSAMEKGLDLVIDIDKDVPVYLKGDNLKLRQVLINLLSNAIKFTAHGQVSLVITFDDDRICFSVEDSGIGISEDDRDKLFISFSQLETGRRFGGVGLGLAISYRLVKAMGGELGFKSVPGEGSCFKFSIKYRPVVESETLNGGQVKRCLSYKSKGNSKKESLLIVSDSAKHQKTLKDILVNAGFDNVFLAGMDKLSESCHERFFDVVIINLDVSLFEHLSLASISFLYPGKTNSKVIAVVDSINSLLACDRQGLKFSDFLVKPFKSEDVLEKVNFCLSFDSRQSLSKKVNGSLVVQADAVNIDALFEMVSDISELLEVGDVDSIFKVASLFKSHNVCGSYPESIMNSCENLDIGAIEQFVSLFSGAFDRHDKNHG